MALDPLVSAADLEDWRDVSAYDPGKIDRAIAVASSAIRDAAGAVISQVTSTMTFNALHDTYLPLPGPITAVSSVTVAGDTVTRHTIEEGGLRLCGGWGAGTIEVTFTHGLLEVPEDIQDLCCDLAMAWLQNDAEGGGSTAGLTSARIDDAAETYSDESAGHVSPVFIPATTRRWLANRFGGGALVVGFR